MQPSSGFDNSAFNSLNAFRFIDAAGKSTPVRWTLAPVQPFAAASTGDSRRQTRIIMFDELIAQHPCSIRCNGI